MGTFARFDIVGLAQNYAFNYFVETGAGFGDSLSYASMWSFRALHSCDVDETVVGKCRERFRSNERVYIEHERSVPFLQDVCDRIPQTTPIVFWLDAHFPYAHSGVESYDFERDANVRLPLEAELTVIRDKRALHRDIIAIDDLRIYMDGPFGFGNLPDELRSLCPRERNIDFIYALMGETHDIVCFYEHEGYVLLTPKSPEGMPYEC